MILLGNNPITADGTYTQSVVPGVEYLLTMKGTYGGGTLLVKYTCPIDGSLKIVDNASYTGAGKTEDRMIFPSNSISFVLSGSTTPSIVITTTPQRNA